MIVWFFTRWSFNLGVGPNIMAQNSPPVKKIMLMYVVKQGNTRNQYRLERLFIII